MIFSDTPMIIASGHIQRRSSDSSLLFTELSQPAYSLITTEVSCSLNYSPGRQNCVSLIRPSQRRSSSDFWPESIVSWAGQTHASFVDLPSGKIVRSDWTRKSLVEPSSHHPPSIIFAVSLRNLYRATKTLRRFSKELFRWPMLSEYILYIPMHQWDVISFSHSIKQIPLSHVGMEELREQTGLILYHAQNSRGLLQKAITCYRKPKRYWVVLFSSDSRLFTNCIAVLRFIRPCFIKLFFFGTKDPDS